jgi:hypothetical protein
VKLEAEVVGLLEELGSGVRLSNFEPLGEGLEVGHVVEAQRRGLGGVDRSGRMGAAGAEGSLGVWGGFGRAGRSLPVEGGRVSVLSH